MIEGKAKAKGLECVEKKQQHFHVVTIGMEIKLNSKLAH